MNSAVEDILNGPDYFECERMHVRMKKENCVRRQGHKGLYAIGESRHLECQNCEQGERIKAEVGSSGPQGLVKTLKHLDSRLHGNDGKVKEVMTMESTATAPMCKDCGERPVVTIKKSGKPMAHGRCSVCQGKAISRAFKKKGYNRKKETEKRQRRHGRYAGF
jgi:hypothetical protein